MDRRSFIGVSVAGLIAIPVATRAQSSGKPPRIGFLNNLNPSVASASTEAFLRGLQDLGWIDGKNIAIEYRWADGDMARHTALVSELVSLPVAVIVTAGTPAVRAAQHATHTIPIVVAIMPDPVALGFAASLARPGGNVTGLANLFEELTPKQLQVLREVLPKATRIALLSDPAMGDRGIQSATETAARMLGLVVRVFQVGNANDLDLVISTAKRERADGVLVLPSPFFNRYRARIAELAFVHKLPTFSESSEYVRDGGLLSYGPNFPQMYYRAANYVDRILKGARPGELPIERPTKFELVVNLKTANALGITLPQQLLLRADEVIR
jgi:putative ABC transport system substrate-binding protein